MLPHSLELWSLSAPTPKQLGWDIQEEDTGAPAGSWSNSVAPQDHNETTVFILGFKADIQAEIALIFPLGFISSETLSRV